MSSDQGAAFAPTPEPPYYAVIFTSLRQDDDGQAYDATGERMMQLAAQQPGFLGVEAVRQGLGITVSYWSDLDAIAAWKRNAEHVMAQGEGRRAWYARYKTRIARVERDYAFEAPATEAAHAD
jgi:heme-degrading monooxygenase HmoA